MKALFTFLLFLVSLSVFSLDTDTLLQYSAPINLVYGIEAPVSYKSINDFSNISKDTSVYKAGYSVDKEEIVPFSPIHNYWYKTDFSNDPFDGRIEILVMGEPLPSAPLTLFISSLVLFTLMKYKKLHNKGEIQEIL